jgi:hypothetical protein
LMPSRHMSVAFSFDPVHSAIIPTTAFQAV